MRISSWSDRHILTIDRIYANDNEAVWMMKASFEHPAGLECGVGGAVCMEITTRESNEEQIKMIGTKKGEIQD